MTKLRNQFGLWMALVGLIIIKDSSCLATTIIAIRTPEVFVIAADSEGTFKGCGRPQTQQLVSKIYHAGGVLYAIGALTKDAGRGYSPADIVAALVQKSPSFPELLANLKTVLSRSLQDELTRLRAEEPLSFQDAIKAGTTVLLGCFENGEPVAIVIGFRGIVGPDGQLRITTTQLACPGDCPIDKPYIFWVGSHNAIARYLARHGKDFSAMLPEAGAKFLVKIEIDAKTPGVGPPVDVAQVSKNGVEWLSRKGQKKR